MLTVNHMNKEEILHKLNKIFDEHFNIDYSQFNIDTALTDRETNCLDLTSIEIVTFIVHIEDAFDIIIDFDTMFETIGDIVDYLYQTTGTLS